MNIRSTILLPALLAAAGMLSCQRDNATSPEADGSRSVAMRLVRTAEVDDYTWNETDSVRVVVRTSSGSLLLEKSLEFTSGKLVFGTVRAAGDQGVTISATGYDKGRVIWLGVSELPPSTTEQTAIIDITMANPNSAGLVSAPEILSRSVSHWMTDSDSVKVYDRAIRVMLRNRRDSAAYRYTLDGSVPNSKSNVYSADSGILVDSTSDLEVIGIKPGWTASAILSESFRLRSQGVSRVSLNVPAWAPSDTFDQPVVVVLASETPDVEIRYTLDGTEPTRESSLYTAAGVVVDSTRSLKAVAYAGKAGRSTETYERSFVLRAQDAFVNALSVEPWAGADTFDRAVIVSLGTMSPDAEIRYTLDGSTPTRSSMLHTAEGILVDSTRTLNAVVYAGKAARSAGMLTKSFVMKVPDLSVESISAVPWAVPDTFDQAIVVKLRTPTPGVEIRYTLDGSTPDETSSLYTSDGVVIDTNAILKAMTWAGKQPNSEVFSRVFSFKARSASVASLSVEPWDTPDIFDEPVRVTLASPTPEAEIRYTLDGTTPTRSSTLHTSAGVLVDSTRTLKAVVFAGKAARSEETLVRTFTLKARTLSVESISAEAWELPGTYDRVFTVKLSNPTKGAEIRYTLDGSAPTQSSSLYASSGIVIDSTRTLNAMVFAGRQPNGDLLTRTFTLRARPASVASLSLNPWAPQDTFDRPVTVMLASETPNAEIRYTLDGSIPTRNSALYTTAGVVVDSTRTLKAVVYAGNADRSESVLSRSFAMKAQSISVESISAEAWEIPDTYDQAITVRLSNPTPGVEIRYTLDGSTPTQSSSLYSTDGIEVDSTRTLKALALAGRQPSGELLTRTFILRARPASVASMSLTPWAPPDTFDGPVTVMLASETPNAEIRYTLDGSIPTRNSALYTTAGVVVDSTRTLKAVVYAGNADRSDSVLTRAFTLRARSVSGWDFGLAPWAPPDTFDRPATVRIETRTPNAEIRYTLDGSIPTRSSALYTGTGVVVDSTGTLKAVVFAGKAEASGEVGSRSFVMRAQPVRFSVGKGLTTFGVAISTPTPECEIRYTTDGTTPSATSLIYADSLRFAQEDSLLIRAIAVPIGKRVEPSAEASVRIGPAVRRFVDSRDGQSYKILKIGAQKWMVQNLNAEAVGSWHYHGNDADSAKKYGRLYNWAALMNLPDSCNTVSCSSLVQPRHQGVCPNGWHVPTDAEWSVLFDAVGGEATAGTRLKSASGWLENGDGTDEYGFGVLPAGFRFSDQKFYSIGSHAYFWSSSERTEYRAWFRYVYSSDIGMRSYDNNKTMGFSARCVEN